MIRKMSKLLAVLTAIMMLFSPVSSSFAESDNGRGYDDNSGVSDAKEYIPSNDKLEIDIEGIEGDTDTINGDENIVFNDKGVTGNGSDSENDVVELEHAHSPGDVTVTKATFDSDGSRTIRCEECGEVLEQEMIPRVITVSLEQPLYIYSGSACTPAVTVEDSQGGILETGVDYDIQYVNNTKVGKAKAKVVLKGDYSGTKELSFVIANGELKRTNVKIEGTKQVTLDKAITDVLGTDITYSMEDPSIATVDSNGIVTGCKKGSTILTATVGEFSFRSTVNVFEEKRGSVVDYYWCGNYNWDDWTWDDSDDHPESIEVVYDGSYTYKINVWNIKSEDYPGNVNDIRAEIDVYDEDGRYVLFEVRKKANTSCLIDPSELEIGKTYTIDVRLDYFDSYVFVWGYDIWAVPIPEMFAFDETETEVLLSGKKKLAYTSDGGDASLIKWKSSDTSVATVSNGTVTGKKPGKCTITATLPNGYTDQCEVVVKQHEVISFTSKKITIRGFSSKKLSLVKQSAIYDTVTWKSSNTKVATVDSKGKVTSKGEGTAVITASIKGSKDTCRVKVVPVIKKKNISIYLKKAYTNKLIAASGKMKWTSSNKKIATVSAKGKIIGKKPGKCTITAKYKGKKYTCKVTVKPIILSKKSANLYRGSKLKLKVTGGSGKIVWKSSKKKVATVSSKGTVKAISPGKCTIIMKRNGYTKKCRIKVRRQTPDYEAYIWDYKTRGNYFLIKIKNKGSRTLKVTSGVKAKDKDYKSFDRRLRLKKKVSIGPGKTKYVRLYVKGRTTWYKAEDFRIYYKFTYDGKKYTGKIWETEDYYNWDWW